VTEYIRNERNILDRLNHPGIAKLKFTFQVGVGRRAQQQHLCPWSALCCFFVGVFVGVSVGREGEGQSFRGQ
jgi:hypothetical protein